MAEVIPTVLLDSVIMIDHFNGVPRATAYLLEMQGKLPISVITRAEVLTGFEGRDRQLARRLLDRFPFLIIDRPYRRSCSHVAASEPLEDAGRSAGRARKTSQAKACNSGHR